MNECLSDSPPCDSENGVCTNTPGGFNCSCRTGFTGNGFNCSRKKIRLDIDVNNYTYCFFNG